jgi:release factor glutamine methyltransferase
VWLSFRFHVFQRHRHRRLVLERVAGLPLVVLPDVFNPALFFSSEALAEFLPAIPVAPGMNVLDAGSGSGLAAIAAARLGARVVALDISPEAVRNTRINVLLNEVEDRVDVTRSDLFEAVTGRTFDVILFNPPYYAGSTEHDWEMAWRSTGVLKRFAEGLPHVLTTGGRAVLAVSSNTVGLGQAISENPIASRILWEKDLVSEKLMVLEWTLLKSGVAPR